MKQFRRPPGNSEKEFPGSPDKKALGFLALILLPLSLLGCQESKHRPIDVYVQRVIC
jgi:hypothetical protein